MWQHSDCVGYRISNYAEAYRCVSDFISTCCMYEECSLFALICSALSAASQRCTWTRTASGERRPTTTASGWRRPTVGACAGPGTRAWVAPARWPPGRPPLTLSAPLAMTPQRRGRTRTSSPGGRLDAAPSRTC